MSKQAMGFALDKEKKTVPCQPGKQVSGQVVQIRHTAHEAEITIDAGNELVVLKQPTPPELDIKTGQHVRARAMEIAGGGNRMVSLWQFADIDRERAMEKGRGGRAF